MMNGKKAIVLSLILVAVVVCLIVLKQTGVLSEMKSQLDAWLAPLKRGF